MNRNLAGAECSDETLGVVVRVNGLEFRQLEFQQQGWIRLGEVKSNVLKAPREPDTRVSGNAQLFPDIGVIGRGRRASVDCYVRGVNDAVGRVAHKHLALDKAHSAFHYGRCKIQIVDLSADIFEHPLFGAEFRFSFGHVLKPMSVLLGGVYPNTARL